MLHMDQVRSKKCSETKPKQYSTGEVQDQDLDQWTCTNTKITVLDIIIFL